MNKKKTVLATAIFFIAISGAFATSMFTPVIASVSKTDRPTQVSQCDQFVFCSNTGEFVCQIQITSWAYPLKERQAPNICVNYLTHDEVFADIIP